MKQGPCTKLLNKQSKIIYEEFRQKSNYTEVKIITEVTTPQMCF